MDKEPLFIAIPSHDQRALIWTILELASLGTLLERPVIFVSADGSNIPRSRNAILSQIRDRTSPKVTAPVLWVDSDILISKGGARSIASAVNWAQRNRVAVTADYLMANGESTLLNGRVAPVRHYTRDEIVALPGYAEVGMCGFGMLFVHNLTFATWGSGSGEMAR